MPDGLFPDGLTADRLLNGRINLAQPVGGYRVAVDPILLAAAVPARAGDLVADLGCGVGAVALCLAWRVPGCRLIGLEREADLAALALRNAAANGRRERLAVIVGDVACPPFGAGSFDHVAMNPPYLAACAASPPAGRLRRVAGIEGTAGLADWLLGGLGLVREGGTLTLVHRADRLDQIIRGLGSLQNGGLSVQPLWPKAGMPARRVLVRCRKGDRSPFRLLPGLILHEAEGAFTAATEKILRDGWALDDALSYL